MSTGVWIARSDGKDSSQGKTRIVADHDYIWFGRDLSVPLAWISEVSAVGPGFQVVWEDRTSGTIEAGVFCIRTMFGYNLEKRDQVVSTLGDLVSAVRSVGASQTIAAAEQTSTCDVCGSAEASVYDFEWIINVLFYWMRKPGRQVLCKFHANRNLRKEMLSNALLGSLGLPGLFMTPIITVTQGRAAVRANLLLPFEIFVYFLLSLVPAALLVWLMVITFQQVA
jgi:hypothetical protein